LFTGELPINGNTSNKRKRAALQQVIRSTDSVTWSRRNKVISKDDPNASKLRVAVDCPAAHYRSKRNSTSGGGNNKRMKKVNKTTKKKLISHYSSDDNEDDNDDNDDRDNNVEDDDGNEEEEEEHNSDDGSKSHDESDKSSQQNDIEDDENDNDDSTEMGYQTDDSILDANKYYHIRTYGQVPKFGSSLPFIGKTFNVINSSKLNESMAKSLNGMQSCKIVAVVAKSGDINTNLHFKIFDPSIHRVPPSNSSDHPWRYVDCKELMGNQNKLAIHWEKGHPTKLGELLVGMKVRRPFKINREWVFFNGEITAYLNKNLYNVLYEDGDLRQEKEIDVIKFLISLF